MTVPDPERPLPSGVVTFLFSDIQGSTPLWEQNPDGMRDSLARHNAIIQEAISANGGQVFKTVGDEFCVVFVDPAAAVRAALAGQRALAAAEWGSTGPLKVRMGLHLGHVQVQDGDYASHTVNRVARIMGAAHGGQILLSGEVVEVVRRNLPEDMTLKDLGQHRMKGMENLEHLYQLVAPGLVQEFPAISSLSQPASNLPAQTLSFVGRETEMVALMDLIDRESCRLVTILGPGGMGKTRLMLQTAQTVIGNFPHGIWLVELAPLNEPELIPERVAAVLGVQEQPGRQMKETLADYLRHKELLLLMDNVEHLIRASAEIIDYLLRQCPKLKLLATSREPLLINGETTYPILSLTLPQPNQAWETIAACEGVQLFRERARAVRPDFAITEQNAAVVGEIVRRLDGIPLALELAAARLRMMTVEQINGRLNDRFRLLTGGSRTALPRQQTLQALIDWSWNLLEQKECLLFQRLSIFSGGWNLESAEAVAGFDQLDAIDVFDGLEQLVNKSLVIVQHPAQGEGHSETRFTMLENIREYAQSKLVAAGEEELLRKQHINYFTTLVAKYVNTSPFNEYQKWLKHFTIESDNLRRVFASIKDDQPGLALQFGGSLLIFEADWLTPREAESWLVPTIAKARELMAAESAEIDQTDYIRALNALGWQRVTHGQMANGLPVLEECIQLARQYGEHRYLVIATSMKLQALGTNVTPENLQEGEDVIAISRRHNFEFENIFALFATGRAYIASDQYELGAAYLAEVKELAEKFRLTFISPWIYQIQAVLARAAGDDAEAEKYMLLALAEYEKTNSKRMEVSIRSGLAHDYRRKGRLDEAEALYRRTILAWQEQGHQTAVAHQIECFGYIAIARGDYGRAARLLGAAQAARKRLNEPSTNPQEIAEYDTAMARLDEAMGISERDRVMAAGGRLSLDEAVILALE